MVPGNAVGDAFPLLCLGEASVRRKNDARCDFYGKWVGFLALVRSSEQKGNFLGSLDGWSNRTRD